LDASKTKTEDYPSVYLATKESKENVLFGIFFYFILFLQIGVSEFKLLPHVIHGIRDMIRVIVDPS